MYIPKDFGDLNLKFYSTNTHGLTVINAEIGNNVFLNQLFNTNPTQPELAFYLVGKYCPQKPSKRLRAGQFAYNYRQIGPRAAKANSGCVGFVLKSRSRNTLFPISALMTVRPYYTAHHRSAHTKVKIKIKILIRDRDMDRDRDKNCVRSNNEKEREKEREREREKRDCQRLRLNRCVGAKQNKYLVFQQTLNGLLIFKNKYIPKDFGGLNLKFYSTNIHVKSPIVQRIHHGMYTALVYTLYSIHCVLVQSVHFVPQSNYTRTAKNNK
eukprot:sb/3468228/